MLSGIVLKCERFWGVIYKGKACETGDCRVSREGENDK